MNQVHIELHHPTSLMAPAAAIAMHLEEQRGYTEVVATFRADTVTLSGYTHHNVEQVQADIFHCTRALTQIPAGLKLSARLDGTPLVGFKEPRLVGKE